MRVGIDQTFERQPLGRIHLRVVIEERAFEDRAGREPVRAPAPRRAQATNGPASAAPDRRASRGRRRAYRRASAPRSASRALSIRRHRAAPERAGDAPGAARCAARCAARAATRAPARARNCADSASPPWTSLELCALVALAKSSRSTSATFSPRSARVARDAGAGDAAADDQEVESLVGKAVGCAAHGLSGRWGRQAPAALTSCQPVPQPC